jgi:hypothetical protein
MLVGPDTRRACSVAGVAAPVEVRRAVKALRDSDRAELRLVLDPSVEERASALQQQHVAPDAPVLAETAAG